MRQIFLLILLFFVGQWFARQLRNRDARAAAQRAGAGDASGAQGARGNAAGPASGASSAGGTAAPQLAEPMIRCAECGVHAPRSDSVMVAGQPFCCTAHARRHQPSPSGRDAR